MLIKVDALYFLANFHSSANSAIDALRKQEIQNLISAILTAAFR